MNLPGDISPAAGAGGHPIWRGILRVVGSALILVLLFHFLPVAQVAAAIGRLPVELCVFVVAGYLAAHLFGVIKWRLLVNLAGAGLSFLQAARCYFAGLFSTLFLPSLIGGDVVRAGLAVRLGRNKAGALLGSLVDRLLDMAALVSIAAVGAALLPGALSANNRRIFEGAGGLALAILAGLALSFALLPARRFSYRMRRRLVRLREARRSMSRRPHYVALALTLGITIQAIFIFLTIRIALASGLVLPLRVWMFGWPLAKLSGLVPVTQAGIGVREAALVALLAPFGARAVLVMAVGLVWEATIIAGGLIAGFFALLAGKLGAGSGLEARR